MSFFTKLSTIKKSVLAAFLITSFAASAQIDSYEVGDMGYLRSPMESANGIILTNNHYSEIYALQNNTLTPILSANNCGLYTNLSKDGKYLGFKSFNDYDQQAPAILDVTTGVVTLLEDYVHECGQVSFANDGTMAYTMGNTLVIRKGNMRKAFDLGFYTNIANISPDASKVTYSSIEGQMFTIDLISGAKEIVPVIDGYRAIWSPDGSKMAILTVTGKIAVQDRSTKRVFDLGMGESVSWANNSTELIFTQQIRKNEFEVTGSTIKKVNFDGSNEIVLVNSSENLPTDAILTSDNKLVTSYKTGAKRGLAVKDLVAGITPLAASVPEKSIITFDAEDVVGSRISDPNENPNIKASPIPAEGSIGALDIPYLSQIYDSPAVNGCTKHGYVTCAPTSACMFLGYYDMLPQKTTYRRSDGTALKYAHAISSTFTSKSGGTTFSTTAYGNGCYNVPGGYGYMWYGSRTPGGGYMASFMKLNGCTSADYTWSSSTAWSKFNTESTAGRPSPLCIALYSSGHLILGFRTNCTYTTAGGFVSRTGSFVCHDPYGDANDSYWGDDDGQHSSYDWVGYNSGRANIGTFYWSIYATVPAATTPAEAKITCNPSTVTLKTVYQSSDKPYVDVKVTATGLSKNMSVNSINSTVTVEKLSGWNDLTGGTLRVTINPNYTLGMGAYAGYIAVQSGSGDAMVRQEIITDISITDSNGNIPSDEQPVAPDQPTITATPTSASMNATVGASATQAITVTGSTLSGNIAATLSGDASFSIDKTSLGTDGGTITVTYKPTAAGSHSATLTLSSTGAASVSVALTGTATASGSSEPSIALGLTKVWQNTTSVPGSATGGDIRFAAVTNDKIIAADKANNKIIQINASGSSDYYDPSAALTEYYGQTISAAIGCDDAGNILISTGWSGAASGKNYAIVSADLKSTYKIDLSTIEGYTPARIDQIGRIRGNMLSSEGGYAFFAPNEGTTILVVKIVNGAIDAGYSQVSNPTGLTNTTSFICQPAFETVAEIDALMDDNGDLSNAFILRSRGVPGSVYAWNSDNSAMVKAWSFTTATSGYTTANASSEGFDWFKLYDKSYFIMPLTTDGTTGTRGSVFGVFDQDGNCVAEWSEGEKTGLGQAFGSFIAVPNNDYSVYIYHFVAGTVAEKFTFAVEPQSDPSGVERIETTVEEIDAPVEYYNLQGVKVANPSNGIFIKVQNGKASKEYIK